MTTPYRRGGTSEKVDMSVVVVVVVVVLSVEVVDIVMSNLRFILTH